MKNISIYLLIVLFSFAGFAQDTNEPTYEKQGDLVAVTNYYEDGSVKEEGFYKDKKLHGEWNKFNQDGEKIAKAQYDNGVKTGTWMFLENEVLTEVKYTDNKIASVYKWNADNKVAIN